MNCAIVIATYNRGPRIRDTIESVLHQSRPVDEFVIVDDGSTDSTASWIRENFPMVAIVEKVNGGTSSARNAGASFAKSDWLIFLDHDDILLPDAVMCLANLLESFPQASSLHADHIYSNTLTGEYHENHHFTLPPFERLIKTACLEYRDAGRLFGYPLYLSLLRGNLLQQPFAVRRECFFQVGGYDEGIRYCEDWDLYLRLALAYKIAVSDQVISIHRVEGENLHLTNSSKQEIMYERVMNHRRASHSCWHWQARIRVSKKLAAIHKGRGDREASNNDYASAWQYYLKSILNWPLDHVVLARLLLWLPKVFSRSVCK